MPKTGEGSKQEETLQDQRKEGSYEHLGSLDDTSSDEDEEEANICLMTDKAFEESELDREDEVNLNDPEFLRMAYHEHHLARLFF